MHDSNIEIISGKLYVIVNDGKKPFWKKLFDMDLPFGNGKLLKVVYEVCSDKIRTGTIKYYPDQDIKISNQLFIDLCEYEIDRIILFEREHCEDIDIIDCYLILHD